MASEVKAVCKHHWHIETPDGVTSPARCVHCGKLAEFYNFWGQKEFKRKRVYGFGIDGCGKREASGE